MTWFRVDDKLHGHPKARQAGLAALGLWVVGGSYSGDQLTDGHVPDWQVSSWTGGKKAAGLLVEAGLWLPENNGFAFHQWDEHQPTREQVIAERERTRKRQAEWRRRRGHGDETGDAA